MKKFNFLLPFIYGFLIFLQACSSKKEVIKSVDKSLFLTEANNVSITTVDCILSDGTTTKCYKITTKSVPTDHEMGP